MATTDGPGVHATGPLAGIRVLDFTHALAGPIATMYLGDLGADIIKIEHPRRGDGTRHMGRPMLATGETDYYLSLNRNKRSVGLHLKTPEDRATALRLAAECDIVVHNFRPGVMERIGLGYDDIRKIRPDTIYVAISGFGETGPLAARGANDITMQAMAGLMSTTGEVGGPPMRIGLSVVDISTGLYGMAGVLAALYHRERTGEGQRVHVSMLASAVSLLANYVPAVLGAGEEIAPAGRGHVQLVPYQAFEARDGRYVIIGAFTQAFWERFCEAIGRPDLLADDRFSSNAQRLVHRNILVPMLEEQMRTRSRDEWLEIMERVDVPSAPVLTVAEALRQPQVDAIGTIIRLERDGQSVYGAALPIEMSATPPGATRFPPGLGADTESVVASLSVTTAASPTVDISQTGQ